MTGPVLHHLNCGTMRPLRTPGGLVCHVLVVESPEGLVLRPVLDVAETAIRQLPGLGGRRRLRHPASVRSVP